MGMIFFKFVVGLVVMQLVYIWLEEAWKDYRTLGHPSSRLPDRLAHQSIFKETTKATLLTAAFGASLWYGQPYGWIADFGDAALGFLFFTVIGGFIEWLAHGGLKDLTATFGQFATWLWSFGYIPALSYVSATLFAVWIYQKVERHRQDVADLKAKKYRIECDFQRVNENYQTLLNSYQEVVAGLETVRREMEASKGTRPSRATELLRVDVEAVLKKYPFDKFSKTAESYCYRWRQVFALQESEFLKSRTVTH